MILKKLNARFGKLDDATLNLSPGLNVIYGKNESGKSTWCDFLRAMFYGIDSKERDKMGFIAEKNKYMPWSGKPMEGRILLSHKGQDITLERSSLKGISFAKFAAYDTLSGAPCDALTADNAGREILGIGKEAFDRSVFITCNSIAVGTSEELEQKILSLATTGDETISFSQSESRLKRWQRERRFNQNGRIPALEQDIITKKQTLASLEQAQADLQVLQQKESAVRGEEQSLAKSQLAKRAVAAKIELETLQAAEEACAAAERAATEAAAPLTKDGRMITRAQLSSALEKASRITHLKEEAAVLRTVLAKMQMDIKKTRAASRETHDTETLRAAATTLASIENAKRSFTPLLFALLFLAAAQVLYLFVPPLIVPYANLITAGFSLFISLLSFVLFFVSMGKFRKLAKQRKELCAEFGVSIAAELQVKIQESMEQNAILGVLQRQQAEQEQRVAFAEKALAEEQHSLQFTTGNSVLANIDESEIRLFDRLLSRSEQANQTLISATSRQRALSENSDTAELAQIVADYGDLEDPFPALSKDEQETRRSELQRTLLSLREECAKIEMFMQNLGTKEALAKQIAESGDALAAAKREYAALDHALLFLNESQAELQSRMTPELNRRASHIFATLTGGRYTELTVKRGFEMFAGDGSVSSMKRVLQLSQGTADQMYLALRLAIITTMFTLDAPPLILDDALINFDETRLTAALEYLREEAAVRQILLFTCHEREFQYLTSDPMAAAHHLNAQ